MQQVCLEQRVNCTHPQDDPLVPKIISWNISSVHATYLQDILHPPFQKLNEAPAVDYITLQSTLHNKPTCYH